MLKAKTMTTLVKTHSKLGASSTHRFFHCPGSVALCAEVPAKPDSAHSLEGTNAHTFMEFLLKREGQTDKFALPNAFHYIGKESELKFDFKITKEMAGFVQEFVDKVMYIFFNLEGAELHVEKKFHLKHIHPDLFGTADVVIVQPFGEIHVIDLKYGAGVVVEVVENTQLLYYGLGAAFGEDYSKMFLHIGQPRAEHKDGTWRTWECTPKYMVEFSKTLKQKALDTEKKNAPLNEGDWCRWCNASAICPNLHKKSVAIAQADFAEVNPKLPEVNKMTDDQLMRVIEYKKLVLNWIDSVEDYVLNRMVMGEKITGLKLVKGRSRREWTDENEVVKKFGDRAFKTDLLTVAQAEKVLGKAEVVGLYETIEGNMQLAHEFDKRKEITNAKDDFAISAGDF
jgi:hypothetical protein